MINYISKLNIIKPTIVLLALIILNFSYTSVYASVDDSIQLKIMQRLQKSLKGIVVDNITPSTLPGFFQVDAGSETFFATEDGRFVVTGRVFDLNNDKDNWDIVEVNRRKERLPIISNLKTKDLIIFSPKKNQHKATITVLTDIDCGYCRRLHSEVDNLNNLGIEIRYISFPRQGLESESYKKSVSIWCSSDRKNAINLAKLGKEIPSASCNSPVNKHLEIAQKLMVQGTPAIFFEDGTLWPGYLPAEQLAEKAINHKLNKAML